MALQSIVSIFEAYSPNLKLQLDTIHFFSKLCNKEAITKSPYFSFYAEKNHPLKKPKFEEDFIRRRSFTRSKKGVNAYMAARDYACSGLPQVISREDISSINRLARELQNGSQASEYNDVCSTIKGKEADVLIYQGPKPVDFNECMDFLVKTIHSSQLHPVLQAALAYYLLILVHPFNDGNGRTSRLLSTGIMKRHGYDLITPAYEEYYIWDKDRLHFLQHARDFYHFAMEPRLIHMWIDYFISSILQAYQELFKIRIACKIAEFKAIFLPQKNAHTLISPVPSHIPLHIDQSYIKRYGPIGGQWAYRDIDGNIIAWNVRFDAKNEHTHKSYFFFQWFSNNTWQRTGMQFTDMLPIYGLHKLKDARGKKVLICEGEKCTDAAAQLLPDHIITVSRAAASGLGAVDQTDWQPLISAGVTQVLIWRDNDVVGKQMEQELCHILSEAGLQISIFSDDALKDRLNKWDIADALAEGMTAKECAIFMDQHMISFVPSASEVTTAA